MLDLTTSVGISSHLYLFGFNDFDDKPPVIIQGYRVGAKTTDVLSLNAGGNIKTASINMTDNVVSSGSSFVTGTSVSLKSFRVESGPSFVQNNSAQSNIFNIGTHTIQTGEKLDYLVMMVIYQKILNQIQYILQLRFHLLKLN